MKKIEAIIRPYRFGEVKAALSDLGMEGMTLTEVKGWGHQKGTEIYRDTEYQREFLPKLTLEIVVADTEADSVVEAILNSARTGGYGDGKVFVSEIEDAIRVRTEEHGALAVGF